VAHHCFLLTPLLYSHYLTATGATLAAVQGAAHHFSVQFAITGADFRLYIGFALQAIPKVA
jgi:hypothetical protein